MKFSVLSRPNATAGEKTHYFALFFSLLFILIVSTIIIVLLHLGPVLEWLNVSPGVMTVLSVILVAPIFLLINFFYLLFARHWWVGFVLYGILYGVIEFVPRHDNSDEFVRQYRESLLINQQD